MIELEREDVSTSLHDARRHDALVAALRLDCAIATAIRLCFLCWLVRMGLLVDDREA